MSSISELFGTSEGEPGEGPLPVQGVNSELDELPLPEGEEFPDTDDLLNTIKETESSVDPKYAPTEQEHQVGGGEMLAAAEEAGLGIHQEDQATPKPDQTLFSSGPSHDESDSDSGGDNGDDQDDLNPDMISVATSVRRYKRDINSVWSELGTLQKQIDSIPQLDITLRKMETTSKEQSMKLEGLMQGLDSIQKSFNAYQTMTAANLADIERRMATHQLRAEAPRRSEIIPPPDVISSKTPLPSATMPQGSLDTPSSVQKKPKVADLSDW